MPIQYITNAAGEHTAVLIPINEWELLVSEHQDLKNLETAATKPKVKLSGWQANYLTKLQKQMLSYVAEGRNEW